MKFRLSALALLLGLASFCTAQSPLRSLKALHALTNTEAAHHYPADFDATVTYLRGYERTLFVQDGDYAIYVQPKADYTLAPGDRIRIQGLTEPSFRPFVGDATITLLHHGTPPQPLMASFEDLVHIRDDCKYVTVRGRVLSADITLSSDRRSIVLRLLSDGGTLDVNVDSDDSAALAGLLDAEVAVTGAVSGRFDGKMEMTGIVLHTQSLNDVSILRPANTSPWTLPVTPMDEILSAYHDVSDSHRVRVQGTVTYYAPGSAAVIQNGERSLWINTASRGDLKLGDEADATGFPDVHDKFLKLRDAEIQDSHVRAPIQPVAVTWEDLAQSHHVFDLVSIDAKVVAQVREAAQDEYDLQSNGHLFSAIFRHPLPGTTGALPDMKKIPVGASVRVTGICILEDANPFNNDVPFDLLLRDYDDIAVIANPSPLSVDNLIRLVSVLLLVVLVVSIWGWMLNRKVRQQTAALATRIASEAALERRNAQIEQRRSRILEDINGTRPLAELLEEITEFTSFQLDGAPCWCEVTDGARLGHFESDPRRSRIVRQNIVSRSGTHLGMLCAAMDGEAALPAEEHAFFVGTRLATLAIETRRLYTDLIHRSEFDLLTDVYNRFSLDRQLEALIARSRDKASVFGLIYIDLDEFKQVNDIYGHRVGDLYLQEACARMKHQLRAGDLLARLGGDEFAALVPDTKSRADVNEIAIRLERCFEAPFRLGGHTLNGSASIGVALYPEDGNNKDSLLSAADAAMYVAKNTRQEREQDGRRGRPIRPARSEAQD
ncbi:MAG: diguanylate cyclase domain-containing protein [Acidobacteriota bacterium]